MDAQEVTSVSVSSRFPQRLVAGIQVIKQGDEKQVLQRLLFSVSFVSSFITRACVRVCVCAGVVVSLISSTHTHSFGGGEFVFV